MNKWTLLTASAVSALCIVGAFSAAPALAQVRAALVENVDEQGRNPYQETQFTICGGPQNCNFTFAVVPNGKRLVVTHVSGFVDVKGGTLPNSNVQSNFGGSNFATIFFAGTRGTVSASSTRIVYNSEVLGYFGPGEQPSGFYGLFSTTDSFVSAGSLTLAGYYINLP